jgi:hypothetical protein
MAATDFVDLDHHGRNLILLPTTTITTAVAGVVTGPVVGNIFLENSLILQAKFVYGSGGTTAKFWVQTSFDRGLTWCDAINFAFTTATATKVGGIISAGVTPVAPTDATLADNTVNAGFLGTMFRVKYTTTGTYAGGTTIYISGVLRS